MILLVGDIGGTNARLAFYEQKRNSVHELVSRVFSTQNFSCLEDILTQFMHDMAMRPHAVCLGVAGPVTEGRARITNLPWAVEATRVGDVTGAAQSDLLNDLEASAYGIFALKPEDQVILHEGEHHVGHACVIAAGTGLGEAGVIWTGRRHVPVACEGGHASFAPTCEMEVELWRHMTAQFGHISYERVVSGQGLINIYSFLRKLYPDDEPIWLRDSLNTHEAPSRISQAGLQNTSRAASLALDIFVRNYASEAGNLALKMMARGGVYLAGGIAPKILPKLQQPEFLQAYWNKGRMGELLKTFPVKVILNDQVALMGAAWFAAFGRSGQTPMMN